MRVFVGDLPCDVHGNPFPPNHRRLMTSIKLTDDIVRMPQITISETNGSFLLQVYLESTSTSILLYSTVNYSKYTLFTVAMCIVMYTQI